MNEPIAPMPIKRMLGLLATLVVAWLLWSGIYKTHLLALGALSCALTIYVARRMGYFSTDVFALRFSPKLFLYWAWLGKEVIKSSLQVAKIILDPRLPISPQVIRIKPSSLDPVDQTILANSITLTPGTLTLDVHNNEITVHALTREGADDVLQGEMDRRVTALREG